MIMNLSSFYLASEHTNHFNPGGHERKIVTKLINTELNKKSRPSPPKERIRREEAKEEESRD